MLTWLFVLWQYSGLVKKKTCTFFLCENVSVNLYINRYIFHMYLWWYCYLNICLNICQRILNKFVNDQNLSKKSYHIFVCPFCPVLLKLHSITCAFICPWWFMYRLYSWTRRRLWNMLFSFCCLKGRDIWCMDDFSSKGRCFVTTVTEGGLQSGYNVRSSKVKKENALKLNVYILLQRFLA